LHHFEDYSKINVLMEWQGRQFRVFKREQRTELISAFDRACNKRIIVDHGQLWMFSSAFENLSGMAPCTLSPGTLDQSFFHWFNDSENRVVQ
jgi:hypothetical protein